MRQFEIVYQNFKGAQRKEYLVADSFLAAEQAAKNIQGLHKVLMVTEVAEKEESG